MKGAREIRAADWRLLFGHRLRFLRTLENLTQGELAGRLGITVEHLSNMERGSSAPSFAMVVRLAEALGTEPANLFLFACGRGRRPDGEDPDSGWTHYIAAAGSYEYLAHTGRSIWSDSLYRILGAEPGELEPSFETFIRHVHPGDRERALRAVSELLAGREVPMQGFRVRRKDGRERYVLTHRAVERDSAGRLARLHGVVLDVTEQSLLQDSLRTMHASLEERVRERTLGLAETVQRLEQEVGRRTRAEALARESESRLRSLGDNLAGAAVFQLAVAPDGALRLALASAGLAALIGAGSEPGPPGLEQVLAAVHSEDREALAAELRQAAAAGRTLCREVRFPRRDGSVAWVRLQAVCRDAGSLGRVCDGLALDITDLKRAEEERRLAVQRLQRAHALAKLGHWEYRPADGSVWWSDEIYEAFGYEPQSRPITLEFFLSHIHPDDREAVARNVAATQARLGEYRDTYRVVRKDGSPGYGYCIGSPVKGGTPGEMLYHGTYLDVTEHKAASAAIQAESRRLKELMAGARLGSWVWEGETVRCDPTACRILGLDPDQGTFPAEQGRAWVDAEDLKRLPDRNETGPVQAAFRTTVRVRPPDGVLRRVLLTGVLYRNPKGRTTWAEGLVLSLDDQLPD